MRKLAIVLIALLILVLAVGATGCADGGGAERLAASELIDKVKASGDWELTIKGMSLTAVSGDEKFVATVPESFDAFEVFGTKIGDTVTLTFAKPSSWGNWAIIAVTAVGALLVGAALGYSWGRRRP